MLVGDGRCLRLLCGVLPHLLQVLLPIGISFISVRVVALAAVWSPPPWRLLALRGSGRPKAAMACTPLQFLHLGVARLLVVVDLLVHI